MSILENTLTQKNRIDYQNWRISTVKLQTPQLLTIILLFVFNTSLIDNIPFKLGPLSPVMLMEAIIFLLAFPWLLDKLKNLDKLDKLLLIVCICMFILSQINFSSNLAATQYKLIFTSIYAYVFIVCFFSGRPEYDIWLRRLHLFPSISIIFSIVFEAYSKFGFSFLDYSIRDNHAACYISIIFPICLAQFLREKGIFKILNLFIMVFAPFMFMISASRTALIVFTIVSSLIIYLSTQDKKFIFFTTILLIISSLFILAPEQSIFAIRISTLRNPIEELELDRFNLWKAALLSIKENLLWGSDFRINVQRLVLESAPESNYARHVVAGISNLQAGVHSGWLVIFVHYGIFVGFMYLKYFFSLFGSLKNTRKIIHSDANRFFLTMGLICMIGYAFSNISMHMHLGHQYFIIWAVLQVSMKNFLIIEKRKRQIDAIT